MDLKVLSDQARQQVPAGLEVEQWIEQYNTLFAKLIVRECGVALHPMLRDMISRGQAYNLIKEHFGVE